MGSHLRQRLLLDIAELQRHPYPNIELHVQDEDLTSACLHLTAEAYGKMHLTIRFNEDYPLSAPRIEMNSTEISHPNIFNWYICASVLNTEDGYTPAYTLKGITIQLLSFFSSETIEQDYGGRIVTLSDYRSTRRERGPDTYKCEICGFKPDSKETRRAIPLADQEYEQNLVLRPPSPDNTSIVLQRSTRSSELSRNLAYIPNKALEKHARARAQILPDDRSINASLCSEAIKERASRLQSVRIPVEVLLLICDKLETEELFCFAEAWPEIGNLIRNYDIIRTRELQCFCLKTGHQRSRLGVGVQVIPRGKSGSFKSEFDLLSETGFVLYDVRRSVQGLPFNHWLPLPISYGHWSRVKALVSPALAEMATAAKLGAVDSAKVIFHFMNDIVVDLNETASANQNSYQFYINAPQSSLTHASEKAIESYFHLFHLLLCLAVEAPIIARTANAFLSAFISGADNKDSCPNLGHLLVAALVSDVEMTDVVLRCIIKETITRNVVWMLDSTGANMPELAYLEASSMSAYRLANTFKAGRTSYRLLMFLALFQRTAVGQPRRPLLQLRDEAFKRHGAPPRGSAKGLADSIKQIHRVDNFPDFLTAMGFTQLPTAASFTAFLKQCIDDSEKKGYHRMPATQEQFLTPRLMKEPLVKRVAGHIECHPPSTKLDFFPSKKKVGQTGSRGGRGGRDNNHRRRGGPAPRGRGRGF